jgi:arabinofuranosyltransferase
MASRFYTAPLFVSVALIVRYWKPRLPLAIAVLSAVVLAGFSIPEPTLRTAYAGFGHPWPVDAAGIADERAFYFQGTALLRYRRDIAWPDFLFAQDGRNMRAKGDKVVVFPNVGMAGFEAGPNVHIIDSLALGDALIARLPIVPGPWRVGHYQREVPGGYDETVRTGVNTINDMNLREYYGHLKPIISGPLFSATRFKEIVFMNLGMYEHLLPQPKKAP